MCGRFTLTTPAGAIAIAFGLSDEPALRPRYNIAPSQAAAIVRAGASTAARRLDEVRWGLIPAWARDPSIGARLINARAETLAEKPAFRNALRFRRCLIPADGFFEWRQQGSVKQPYWITLASREVFAFAGVWERWKAPNDGLPIDSFTIVTTEANDTVRSIHTRMPVILSPDVHPLWLDPLQKDPSVLLPWLTPCTWAPMTSQAVSRRVNSSRYDDAECLSPPW